MSNHSYYDDLRAANFALLERQGTLDVFSLRDADDNAEPLPPNELALCHLTAMWRYSTLVTDPGTGFLIPRSLGPEFFGDSSSVLMAMHHFNNGIPAVVDDVDGINERCPIRFTAEFFDTFSSLPRTIETMTRLVNRSPTADNPEPQPCAVLGAFRSAVSTPLSILTGVYGLPQLSPVSSSPGLDDTNLHPLFSRLVPSDAGTSLLTAKFFSSLNVQHVGVINVNDAYGSAYQDAFKRIAESLGLIVATFSIPFKPSQEDIQQAVAGLKNTGYRYFFGIIFGPEHYDLVMTEAYEQGIAGNPDEPTFWIFGGGVQRYVEQARYKAGSPLALATRGQGMIQADGGIEGMLGFDRYLKAWKNLTQDDIDYFNSKQPLGYYRGDADYFKRNEPERESLFAYDAVMTLGLAACNLLERKRETNGEYFSGEEHFDEIVRTKFVGASGSVDIDPETTSRDPESALYVIFNSVPSEPDEDGFVSFSTPSTLIHLSSEEGWQNYKERPFVFNHNTTEPPPALPLLTVNQNYIGTGLRVFGLILSWVAVAASIVAIIWTMKNLKSRVVRASQPIFLILICVGCLLMGASIVPLSIDDEIASTRGCSISCMLVPWLYTVGFALVFAALYSKTKRITLLLQQRRVKRIKVSARDVMLPLISLLAANILVLILWTALSPMQFQRRYKVGRDRFGRYLESYGGCLVGSDGDFVPYVATLAAINAGVLLFANIQAYRAREIHTEFSESRYIGIAMISMLQSWVVGIPVMFIVSDNPHALFLVLACVVFVGCIAILGLIMLPKFLQRKKKREKLWRRGSFISGLEMTTDDIEKHARNSISVSGIEDTATVRMSARLRVLGNMESDQNVVGNGVDSDSTAESEASGVKVYANAAMQKNIVLEANLADAKRKEEDILNEMKSLLRDADEDENGVLQIDRHDLEQRIGKYSEEPARSRLIFEDENSE
eukprot:CAMPEP_0197442982 /NCGR_PEP_ID=MMETSP1175-20131217/8862_1 /TAXON_ID=1003142 /ORGANISM="Triceratium dubium, Strain CCMP147" /LENGTH=948 /DNA_ID=CAMNT_0042973555 /DNA_START=106 /DNA_END=2952 /DNA_ORIENTATION=+